MTDLRMGDIYRQSRPQKSRPEPEIIDGLPNIYYYTNTPKENFAPLASGINPMKSIVDKEGVERRPVIIITSSPHKTGSKETPWQDYFDPDNGHIRYYGDNKKPDKNAADTRGNKALYAAYQIHSRPDEDAKDIRIKQGVPIVFFLRVRHDGRSKGNLKFQGFGITERIEVVTQYDNKHDRYFTNYVFDFVVFKLTKENECFPWKWISDRRDITKDAYESNKKAPKSWQLWLSKGTSALEACRRRVSKLSVYDKLDQVPVKGSEEDRILSIVMRHYKDRKQKSKFEALAMFVIEKLLLDSKSDYQKGWLTNKGGDGGIDFVGRLDIGSGFSAIKVILLGQAKCESLGTPTSGVHLAR